MPTSVVEVIKDFLDALSNISAELSGCSVYAWVLLLATIHFCTRVKERKNMAYPVDKY